MTFVNQLFLVRHGESTGNLNSAFLGRKDPALTEKGVRQAHQLAKFFSTQSIGHLFTSPLKRALETTDYISRATGKIPVIEPSLIEQDFGTWDGIPVRQVADEQSQAFNDWIQGDIQISPGKGENLQEVLERIRPFFETLCYGTFRENLGESSVIVVSHGSVIQAALCYLLETRPRNVWPYFQYPGSITTLQLNRRYPVMVQFGFLPEL